MTTWLSRLVAAVTALLCATTFAADFPTQPIRIVVPFAPGGGVDMVARTLADRLGPILGTQVLVDNRPGGNSVIATRLVAEAPADGHTLLLTTDFHAINAAYAPIAPPPYDSLKDFSLRHAVDHVAADAAGPPVGRCRAPSPSVLARRAANPAACPSPRSAAAAPITWGSPGSSTWPASTSSTYPTRAADRH